MVNRLIKGETLQEMAKLPSRSVDMILADLPYQVTKAKWDIMIPFDELWEQYNRLIKDDGAIVLFSQQPFTSQLVMSNPKMFRYEIIWNKVRTTGFLNANRMPLKQHENILVFYKKLPTYNSQKTEGSGPSHSRGTSGTAKNRIYGHFNTTNNTASTKSNMKHPTDILTMRNQVGKGQLHPTQKPVELMEWLIKTYSNDGETVLDNVMGSGSTGIAAINTNRDFIGIELDTDYFEIATNRIRLWWKVASPYEKQDAVCDSQHHYFKDEIGINETLFKLEIKDGERLLKYLNKRGLKLPDGMEY
ncbi:site-specific DNA-methyltransferase [Weissella diestrammenae]|uniref:Methyltransferase n=1 Tax=Weissella diestrammenae TaxID=1162633 RepID=A0A7G9T4P5_9LACO|nr:site-specific DNA-methyltransferase [Weissella diestrammenae]MCM0582777.1 site-specific DNA-methyltransferase [Weissella diestrammenae]QNN75070.1 site-specific DNA-methyltransferase [Weissella diestrammenae]